MFPLAAAFFAAALPSAVVLQPVVNMYSKPSKDADVLSQAIYGVNVGIIEERAGWARIRTPDDYAGWVPAGAVRVEPLYAAGAHVEVTSLFAHLYREPSVTRYAPLLTVPFEAKLEITGWKPEDAWQEVRLVDGRTAWVQTGDVAFGRKPISTAKMLTLSRRFLGLPYTWGGTSSYGYDCSGFTQMLERQRGILMPRDAQPQAEWRGVAPVAKEDLEPGDLLYFGSSDKHITHTGLYLGDGKFINATTYRIPTVRIDDLRDPHWVRLLVAARRVK